MTQEEDARSIATAIIGSSLYMVLGTADEDGLPWTSPVYYAHERYATFYWLSAPERRHSRNLAVRPQLSIVIFDSGAPIYAGQAVYMSAGARQVGGAELEQGIAIFSNRSQVHGSRAWTPDDVTAPAEPRLFVADVSEHWIVEPHTDHRVRVTL